MVLFSTAKWADNVQGLAGAKHDKSLLLFNVKWQSGHVILDFRFGDRKRFR